jgi:hypothetical protein
VSDQPTILDRPFDARPVFIDATAGAQERQIDQFCRDPLIPLASEDPRMKPPPVARCSWGNLGCSILNAETELFCALE